MLPKEVTVSTTELIKPKFSLFIYLVISSYPRGWLTPKKNPNVIKPKSTKAVFPKNTKFKEMKEKAKTEEIVNN